MNGNPNFDQFMFPVGQTYIAVFMFIFKILLMSLLAALFINKYKEIFKNLEGFRLLKIIKLKNSVAYDKYIGGATITFFPINIIMAPFLFPIINMRSQRVSDFVLKLQYLVMIFLYLLLAFIIIVPMSPFLYCKVLVNGFFIAAKNTKEDFRGQNMVQLAVAVFLSPFIIPASIVVDFVSIPNLLLKDSKDFERKYQLQSERFNDYQIDMLMKLFKRIFYTQEWVKYKGRTMTMNALMIIHRKVFDIVNNMHDLMCRGSKDYR